MLPSCARLAQKPTPLFLQVTHEEQYISSIHYEVENVHIFLLTDTLTRMRFPYWDLDKRAKEVLKESQLYAPKEKVNNSVV